MKRKIVDDYLDYLCYEKNYSNNTIINYNDDICEYLDYIDSEGLDFRNILYSDIRFYLMYLKDTKKDNNSSIDRKLSAIRGFYKYLANNKVVKNNVFSLVSGPKKSKRLPRFFEYNELEELFDACDLGTSLGQRDRLLLEMLYATGVRVSELVNIKVSDIDEDGHSILVLGKGNKERYVTYGDYCSEILDLYLSDGYLKLNTNKSCYLFLNNNGGNLTDRGVRYILDRIIKHTSIQKNISPHMIRHSFATHLLNEGCDIKTVQELLGHESLESTQIYTHVSNEHLRSVYLKCHPLNNKSTDK